MEHACRDPRALGDAAGRRGDVGSREHPRDRRPACSNRLKSHQLKSRMDQTTLLYPKVRAGSAALIWGERETRLKPRVPEITGILSPAATQPRKSEVVKLLPQCVCISLAGLFRLIAGFFFPETRLVPGFPLLHGMVGRGEILFRLDSRSPLVDRGLISRQQAVQCLFNLIFLFLGFHETRSLLVKPSSRGMPRTEIPKASWRPAASAPRPEADFERWTSAIRYGSPPSCRLPPTTARVSYSPAAPACRRADGHHRRDLRRRSLPVRQVILADLLTDRDHDALPADHRSQTQGDRHRNLNPWRNELGRAVEVLLVIRQDLVVVSGEC